MKKREYLLIIPLIIAIIITIYFMFNKNYKVITNSHIPNYKDNKMISLLVETSYESGEYKELKTNFWPEGYKLNKDLSKCLNGSLLEFDEDSKRVYVEALHSDRCYVYFDAVPEDDIHIAVTNLPEKLYQRQANLSCSGGNVSYNNKYQRLEVSSFNNNINCTLNYTDRENVTYLNNHIIDLARTNQGDGQVVNENGYRYEGKNPNNYIWFNNEMWRIIGVFDSDTHGVENTNLVKIIRNESIGLLKWHEYEEDYSIANSMLINTLNDAYLYKKDGTNNEYCASLYGNTPGDCNFSNIGIDPLYRSMIKESKWYQYGETTGSADSLYIKERLGTSVAGYIGLMYASDYAYSTPCSRSILIDNYGTTACSGQSWLYGYNEWTLTAQTTYKKIFAVTTSGVISGSNLSNNHAVRPSLYLDASVFLISGSGTESDPYIIGM